MTEKYIAGDKIVITKPVLVKRQNGKIEPFSGKKGTIVKLKHDSCLCDIGLQRPVILPYTHLKLAE